MKRNQVSPGSFLWKFDYSSSTSDIFTIVTMAATNVTAVTTILIGKYSIPLPRKILANDNTVVISDNSAISAVKWYLMHMPFMIHMQSATAKTSNGQLNRNVTGMTKISYSIRFSAMLCKHKVPMSPNAIQKITSRLVIFPPPFSV